MRRALLDILLVVALGTSCAQTPGRRDASESGPGSPAAVTSEAASGGANPAGRAGTPPRYPAMNPITPVQGRVTFVNAKLRFVIADFAFHLMPQVEQRLGLYREGVRVGGVRISGPSRGTTVVADVLSGEAQVGDQVRED